MFILEKGINDDETIPPPPPTVTGGSGVSGIVGLVSDVLISGTTGGAIINPQCLY